MGAGASMGCTTGEGQQSTGGGFAKSKSFVRKKKLRFANKQASLTLQGAVSSVEDIFEKLAHDTVNKSEIEKMRKEAKKIDLDLWLRIMNAMRTMDDEDKADYVHKLHTELQLFTKTLKLLDKILEIDERNVGKAITFLTQSLKVILNCEHVTLFIMDRNGKSLRTHSSASVSLKVQVGKGIAGKVAETGEALNIEDAYKNPLFDKKFDIDTGFKTDTILCVPLRDENRKITAVLEGVNSFDGIFNEMHLVNMQLIGAQVCNVIKKCELAQQKSNHERGTKALFKLFKVLYTDLPMDVLLRRIIDTAKEMVSSERATLYLYDETKDMLWAQSGHGLNNLKKENPKGHTILLKGNEGVAGKALSENKVVNISEVRRKSQVWNSKFDDLTGFQTRTILAVPIQDIVTKKRLGVLQVMNKKVGPFDFLTDSHFTNYDEKLLLDFCIEIGRAIGGRILEAAFQLRMNEEGENSAVKTQLMEYTKKNPLKKTKSMRLSMMDDLDDSFKEGRSQSLANVLENGESASYSKDQVRVWHYDVSLMTKQELCNFVKDLFYHLGLHKKFKCDPTKLEAFIQEAGETYEDVPYHNFNHAVSVLHGVYAFLTIAGLKGRLDKIEILALFVGALCHDLGHDGFTNGFHIATMSDLAVTYNDTHVQENLHASLCNKLLNKEETRFVSLDKEDFLKLRKLVINLIISTDMAEHMALTTSLGQMEIQWDSPEDRIQIMKSVLHAVDVSTPCKPKEQAVVQSKKLAEEFKRQVDKELSLGMEPLPFMAPKDESARAQLEVNFIDYIVQPLWESVMVRFPECEECVSNLQNNRKYYQEQLETPGGG
ncbi:3',5'-cyclic-nucleotide phosphodiesterase [Chloropicon primus]|uniref:Phosphodiesterase n=1 Tax=Chloropicon primus TaxID=1764295 RepID=A0A5B8MYW0_9CHLO|nr:3',5'-cyclic-nucleotide phosphodiesterase [Chloropicon primus]UPR04982.1 3',5'-cyclic-nucleotide phosphodiesterase [Chloropicon primus]|eukprot:QDZ25787.1 3',5'-cyclic-nucleotide phosphodiesterase [Chloropicon primus]